MGKLRCLSMVGLISFSFYLMPVRAHAQSAMCMTPVGGCPMMGGGMPGSFCTCSGAPQFPGRVVFGGNPNPQPRGGNMSRGDDDEEVPVIHKKKKHKKPVEDDDDD